MSLRIHFIGGLPRSGSTLLAAILRQNPRFHASIQSPLFSSFVSLLKSMSGAFDSSLFISDDQRRRMLRAIAEAYYSDMSNEKVVFDTNRGWPALLTALSQLFPRARMLCCVRNPAWILDSMERQVQHNCLQPSRIFNYDSAGNVYTRVEFMIRNQLFGPPLQALRQAWFSEDANRLIIIRYASLSEQPAEVMSQVYDLLSEEHFPHDFDHLDYDQPEYDSWLGMPGFHKVVGPVEARPRATILPSDLFGQYDECFWDRPDQNPRGVTIL